MNTYEYPRPSAASASSLPTAESQQPPQLPDTSTWVRRAPGDVIEAGTPYVGFMADGYLVIQLQSHAGRDVTRGERIWTPPPVEPAPWERIPEGRENAQALVVNGVVGTYALLPDDPYVWHATPKGGISIFTGKHAVTSVEPLHLHNPETHVPVERALIDAIKGAREGRLGCPDVSLPPLLVTLAALADGAKS